MRVIEIQLSEMLSGEVQGKCVICFTSEAPYSGALVQSKGEFIGVKRKEENKLSTRLKAHLTKHLKDRLMESEESSKQIHLSVSHTFWNQNIWIVGIASTHRVGVDIECSLRNTRGDLLGKIATLEEIKIAQSPCSMSSKFQAHSNEDPFQVPGLAISKNEQKEENQEILSKLGTLELWTIKEASFKANSKNHASVLTQYHVQSWDPDSRTGTVQYKNHPDSNLIGKYISLRLGIWIISFAWFPPFLL